MTRRKSLCLLVAVSFGLLPAQPRASAAEGQHAPQTAGGQADHPKFLNPYVGNSAAIAEGRMLFQRMGCEACHGPSGEGHMCPAVNDDVWKFGGDDETLHRLIKGEQPGQTMPTGFGKVLTDDQIWEVLAWIRSIYKGRPSEIVWQIPGKSSQGAAATAIVRQR